MSDKPAGPRQDDARKGATDNATGEERAGAGESGLAARQEPDAVLALAVIVHDIRTPLGAISATADMLAATELNERQSRYVDTLRQAASALNDLASELIEQAGEISPQPKAPMVWNPREYLTGIGDLFAAKAQAKGIRFEASLSADLDMLAEGDPNAVRRILSNLLDNAIKFTASGTVRLSAVMEARGRALIQVRDEGPGIAAEELATLFTPYTQGASGMNLQRGSGLGLWISKTLAGRLGGTLEVESTVGEGTCFSLRIPCARMKRPRAAGQPAGEANQAPSAPPLPQGLNVLVVDDNALNRVLITTFLDSFGMRFHAVASGGEALAAIGAQAFDAVIMDLQMPEMDGIETAVRMREAARDVPIIALTAGLRPNDTKRLRAASFCATLGKPFAPADLLKALEASVARADRG